MFTVGDKIVAKLSCQNYGLYCSFMTKEDVAEKIIQEFREHAMQEHFIDYPEGILRRFIEEKNR